MLQKKKIALCTVRILLCLLLSGLWVFPVYADSVIAEGTLEDGFFWSLTEEGTLTISGTGELAYDSDIESPWKPDYQSQIVRVIVEEGITGFNFYCLNELENIVEIQLPESLEKLEGYLLGCNKVEIINLPKNLTQISADVFRSDWREGYYVPWLKEQGDFFVYKDILLLYQGSDSVVRVPDNIRVIDEGVFRGNEKISEIILPEGLQEIGNFAFKNCYNLEKLNLPESIQKIGLDAFSSNEDKYGIPWLKTQGDFLIHNGTLYWSRAAYDNTTEIIIPDNVRVIAPGVFEESRLREVVFPEGLEHIGARAFHNTEISELNLPKSVKSVDDRAFFECPLEYVVIPDGLMEIGENAFGTAELLSEDEKIPNEFVVTEDVIYGSILVVLLVFIVAYIIGIICGGYLEGEPLSKEYRKTYKFNQIAYSTFCILFMCVIICVELNINKLPFEGEWIEKVFDITYEYIMPWMLLISGLLWFLTELIRTDFPWGMARVGARCLKFVVLIIITVVLTELMRQYPNTFIFVGYLALAALCFFVAWLLIQLAIAIPVLLDYLLSQIFRRDIVFFRKLFEVSMGAMEFATDLFDSLPSTYEDVRIPGWDDWDDDVRKIRVDGETRKLRRENPYSDVFVDVKDPTKRYEEVD